MLHSAITPGGASIKHIKLVDVYPNPEQPRKRFDPDALADLASSIEQNGLIQPITVIPDQHGMHMIVAGERRYRAHKLLEKQGKAKSIPCIIQSMTEEQIGINAIIENEQRVDVSLMEQARSYKRMIDIHGLTVQDLAKRLGKRLHKVEETLTFNNLNEQYQQLLDQGHLYLTQAAAMAGLSSNGQDLLFKHIKSGQCRTVTALKGIAQTIADAEAQTDIFGEGLVAATAPEASAAEKKAANGFEGKIDALATFLRDGIDDNTVTAIRKVNPGRASTVADLLAQMQKDLHRMESAFRVAAVQEELLP